ncbi:reverse transcriptase (RNA-dependent DNA polymerase) domain-containing protein [Phthorimaea operculella]|nr:reverse transcriptase (RNA-dependent DNA polymerase) domain-containing protein [Phthorimaea operculella]
MFQHKKIHTYTRAEGASRTMIDFVIVDEILKKKVMDTRAYSGVGIDTDHSLVISRISGLFNRWRHRVPEQTSVLERVKVEKLQDKEIKKEYIERLKEKFSGINEMTDIEEGWKGFREGVVDVAIEVCGISKRTKGKTQRSAWMTKEVQEVVQKKKKAWLDWLATKANRRMLKATDEDVEKARKEYKSVKDVVKKTVDRMKDKNKDEFDRRLSENFRSNLKVFWKSIKTARGKTASSELSRIRSQDGSVIKGEECVLKRWKEHFESLFEKEDLVQEITIPEVNDIENESEIEMDEIVKALKSMKSGKAAGYDRVSVEMLKAGEGVVASQLYLLFNLCWRSGRVPSDWCKAVIVPLYKGKGSQLDSKNYHDLKESVCGLRMNDLLVKCLLYADDQVILASSAEELQEMVNIMNKALKKKGMKVNVSKTKAMVLEKEDSMTECTIMIEEERV